MTGPATVLLHRLPEAVLGAYDPGLLAAPLGRLARRLGLPAPAAGGWALKVQLGPPGRPAETDPTWARAVGELLPTGSGAFDTLSITTEGLHTLEAVSERAHAQGYGPAAAAGSGGLPFRAVDGLAPLGALPGLATMGTVRPHPHLGLWGAVACLGVDLADRAAKLELHRGIRPRVDTPLCAGCGSCLAVCLFDAIVIRAGRAFIDHSRCTGCGECMTVCHMAGITPEDAAGIPLFQERVAEAAVRHAADSPRRVHFLFLTHLDRGQGRAVSRRLQLARHLGVLASADPVALDQAAWDLLARRAGGELAAWSGFRQVPEPLLAAAAALGLGRREYRLVESD